MTIKLLPEVEGLILNGNCLNVLKELEDNSVDSIVTDPPYELGFMGKSWDNSGIANSKEMWKECLRVLKHGGYLLAFGGTRTYHRMACAIEDAGFEIRDMIEWTYGSGFPKSLNIGKAIDKMQGNEREVIGSRKAHDIRGNALMEATVPEYKKEISTIQIDITKGTSKWEGWGTALKPAHEPIVMARKPLAEKTVAENVLKYGTGGINIDESRVGTEERTYALTMTSGNFETTNGGKNIKSGEATVQGRFPANLIHDGSEEVLKEFEKAGISKGNDSIGGGHGGIWTTGNKKQVSPGFEDSGTPARFFKQCEFTEQDFEYAPFFYCAKASKSERNNGCNELEEKELPYGSGGGAMPSGNDNPNKTKGHNNHPTVKPLKLMEYLIKMVTPKGGVVLDPFAGSGTTLVASKKLGYKYIGIELTDEYLPIIKARLNIK